VSKKDSNLSASSNTTSIWLNGARLGFLNQLFQYVGHDFMKKDRIYLTTRMIKGREDFTK
jgi:hypothetical protein